MNLEKVSWGGVAEELSAPSGSRSVLMLSLVHPDFLAPIYSVAQVLRDLGFVVDIVSFSSPFPTAVDLGAGVQLHDCGPHSGALPQRVRARRRFRLVSSELVENMRPRAIIAACPFSFLEAMRWRAQGRSILYHSYEMYNETLTSWFRSPGSAARNWLARRRMRAADLVCVPSRERAEWLFARAGLSRLPSVVLNVPYRGLHPPPEESREIARRLLPDHFHDRELVIHTGNVTSTQFVRELVSCAEFLPPSAALIVTNVGASAYAIEVSESAATSRRARDIALLPGLPRREMLALQRVSRVGVCLIRPGDNVESSLPAPNKVAEYLHASLVVVGTPSEYLSKLDSDGVGVVVPEPSARLLGEAICRGLALAANPRTVARVRSLAAAEWEMREQIRPILAALGISRR